MAQNIGKINSMTEKGLKFSIVLQGYLLEIPFVANIAEFPVFFVISKRMTVEKFW